MIPIQLPPGVVEGPAYGTPSWFAIKRGMVTASRFGDVMTEPKTKAAKEQGMLSDTASGYLYELVAAAITGQDRVGGKSMAMDRGVDMEADAIDAYSASRFVDVAEGRLVYRPDIGIGATPDGFVEEDESGPGVIEVKCPESKRHLETWLSRSVPEDYVEQVQGQLWISGRAWCDFISFDDRFPASMQLVVIRVLRDEETIGRMDRRVTAFAGRVRETLARVKAEIGDGFDLSAVALESSEASTTFAAEDR